MSLAARLSSLSSVSPVRLVIRGGLPTQDKDDSPEKILQTHKLTALVVDDELFVAWHLETMLQEMGLEVIGIASTGLEAIALAEEKKPDLVFMDVNLNQGIDGIEAARRIRSTHPTRIVFVTAYSDGATRGRIEVELPGASVLAKPATFGQLRATISEAGGPGNS